MPEEAPLGARAAAAPSEISSAIRERYLAYRRARAEHSAWLEIDRGGDPAVENQLRTREETALDELIKSPAGSLADVAVKLEVLRELSSGGLPSRTNEMFKILSGDVVRLSGTSDTEGRMIALRLTLSLLLNASAPDRESLERTRQAVIDLIDRPDSPLVADPKLTQAAKDEVTALFSWID